MKRLNPGMLMIALAGLFVAGCLVVPAHHRVVVVGPPVEYDYQPVLYDGYVVYYTDMGVPYYWVGGAQVWVPVHMKLHYHNHWKRHHRSYKIWSKKRGKHYRVHSIHSYYIRTYVFLNPVDKDFKGKSCPLVAPSDRFV